MTVSPQLPPNFALMSHDTSSHTSYNWPLRANLTLLNPPCHWPLRTKWPTTSPRIMLALKRTSHMWRQSCNIQIITITYTTNHTPPSTTLPFSLFEECLGSLLLNLTQPKLAMTPPFRAPQQSNLPLVTHTCMILVCISTHSTISHSHFASHIY